MSRLGLVAILTVGAAAGSVRAQGNICAPCEPSDWGENCIRFHNTLEVGGPVQFPNFNTPGGNVAGDALWKVYPKELFQRASGTHCFTGFIYPLNFVNWATNSWYMHPGFQIRRVRLDAQGNKVPDFDAPFLFQSGPNPAPQPAFSNGWWLIKSSIETDRTFAVGLEDIAFVILAPAGISATSGTPAYQAFHSRGERYGMAPQRSFSGRYNAATRQTELLVPPLTPEPTELMTSVCLFEPIIEFASTTSGGSQLPEELHFGVGAFYNDLATAGGRFRVRGEHNNARGAAGRVFGVPMLSLQRYPPSAFIPGRPCVLDLSPSDPLFTAFLALGQFRYLQERYRNSTAWETYYESDWIPVPSDPALRGSRLLFAWVAWAPPPLYNFFLVPSNSVLVEFR